MKIIEVKKLHRYYTSRDKKRVTALNNVSFDIFDNEIFGILGTNGAGKTTLIKIMSTFLAPSEGCVKVFGKKTFGEEKSIRPKINFIFGGERGLYNRLSAYDNLLFFGDLYLVPYSELKKRINYLLELVGLYEVKDRKVETFSKGMVQKLQIAKGLINDPLVLFLDEPTIGLDPVAVNDLHNIIYDLKARGKTIILTTHYMHEADKLCDRIAFISKGEILDIGTSDELKLKYLNTTDAELEDLFVKVMK
ncbi:hypothetical protein Aargi30884_17450 [Amedibacterium intestinale]|uniref:ABC transporter domain-containing protein n=1 Tax=Amedibacterium intestinale TaxID=2583452 RepID=A0A6N4TL88_9FIRM|nr:ABC transporter ATP-binding protein [Amedibacterium intestinale]BBK22842.1 hypothetical protein Aargi30884_17450 [Amedibacterium intestinale]